MSNTPSFRNTKTTAFSGLSLADYPFSPGDWAVHADPEVPERFKAYTVCANSCIATAPFDAEGMVEDDGLFICEMRHTSTIAADAAVIAAAPKLYFLLKHARAQLRAYAAFSEVMRKSGHGCEPGADGSPFSREYLDGCIAAEFAKIEARFRKPVGDINPILK